jgi:hypothetical protein
MLPALLYWVFAKLNHQLSEQGDKLLAFLTSFLLTFPPHE